LSPSDTYHSASAPDAMVGLRAGSPITIWYGISSEEEEKGRAPPPTHEGREEERDAGRYEVNGCIEETTASRIRLVVPTRAEPLPVLATRTARDIISIASNR
jgi:hypothetical protein